MASAFTSSTYAGRSSVGEIRSRAVDRDRRVAHRVPCRLQWWNIEANEPAACTGETTNLSARGLGVQINRRLVTGTHVEAYLPNLNGDPTKVAGTVVHCRRILADAFEVGIRFVDSHPE